MLTSRVLTSPKPANHSPLPSLLTLLLSLSTSFTSIFSFYLRQTLQDGQVHRSLRSRLGALSSARQSRYLQCERIDAYEKNLLV